MSTEKNSFQISNVLIVLLTCLYMVTEVLSAFHVINAYSIWCIWILGIGLAFYARRKKRTNVTYRKKKSTKDHGGILLWGLIVFLIILGVMAVSTVPYNWDSMTYHLTRIVHWVQEGSVDYFVTNNRRQLISPVLAEYVLLHLYLLTGTDLFFNCLQWFSLIGCICILYQMMKKLGISKEVSMGCLLLLVMAPVVVGESLCTQVDLFAAMCLLLTLSKIFDFAEQVDGRNRKENVIQIVYIALSIGLCYLAKPNICFSVLVALVWMGIICLCKKIKCKQLLLYVVIGAVIVLLIPLPVFVRNMSYAGDPFALEYMGNIGVGSYSPKYLVVNAYKNLVALGHMDFDRSWLMEVGTKLATVMGISINDPQISYGNYDFQSNVFLSYDHDYAGAGFYVTVLVGTWMVWLVLKCVKKTKANDLSTYTKSFLSVLLVQFVVVMCVVKWQPWVNRLLLPAVVPTVILLAYMVQQLTGRFGKACKILIYVMVILAIVDVSGALAFHDSYAQKNMSENFSRWELYFAKRNLSGTYETLCSYADGCSQVGIYAGGDSFEYPVWVKVKESSDGACEIQNVVPDQEIADFYPECIIVLDQDCSQLTYHGRVYQSVWKEENTGKYSVLK